MNTDPTSTDFTPPELEEIAKLLPNYEIISFIAKGGMGAVYLARQKSLDREVAIKILPRHFGEDEEFRSSFETEAKSMAKLNHPNLVGIYDFGQVDGMLYIIMEMVHGESLYHSAYGKTIAPEEAGRIVCDICSGLSNAHEQDILHRDIKPANILLDRNTLPKISDFGLARPVGDHEADSAFGTPGYTAPEVVHNPTAVDESTDLYSVGAILYELLTSKLPETLYMPAANLVQCDPRFDDIIRKAMNPNPVLRYRSAKAMAEAIQEIINDKNKPSAANRLITAGSSDVPPSPQSSTSPPVVKNSSSGPLARNIIIIIILLGSIYAAWDHYKKRKIENDIENAGIIEQNEQKKVEAKKQQAERRKKAQGKSSKNNNRKSSAQNSYLTKKQPKIRPKNPPIVAKNVRCEELEELRKKCFELTQNKKAKYDKQFSNNIKGYEQDLSVSMRSLTREKQEIYASGIGEMKNRYQNNKIPDDIPRGDMPEKFVKIYDDRLKIQTNIENEFLKETDQLRDFYRKNLDKITQVLKDKNLNDQIPTVQQEIDATRSPGQDFVDYILEGN